MWWRKDKAPRGSGNRAPARNNGQGRRLTGNTTQGDPAQRDPGEGSAPPAPRPAQKRGPRLRWASLAAAVLAACVAGVGLLGVIAHDRGIALPEPLRAQIEARLGAALGTDQGAGQVGLGAARIGLGPEGAPVLLLRAVALSDGAGAGLAQVPELAIALGWRDLARGALRPTEITLRGADLSLRRGEDGALALRFDTAGAPLATAAGLAELPGRLGGFLERPALSGLGAVRAQGLRLRYEDARAGRSWDMAMSQAALIRDAAGYRLELAASFAADLTTDPRADPGADLATDLPAPPALRPLAEVSARLVAPFGAGQAALSLRFANLVPGDIASQLPAVSALGLLEAPISGTLRTEISKAGVAGPVEGTLAVGAGLLRAGPGAAPIALRALSAGLTYTPEAQRLRLEQIALESPALSLGGSAQIYLRDLAESGAPQTLLVQLALDWLELREAGLVAAPVRFEGGALDARIRLDPFTATIGQAALFEGETALRGAGEVAAGPGGWQVALDGHADTLSAPRLLALWPEGLRPGLRTLLSERIIGGEILRLQAALRLAPGAPARFSVMHRFEGARFAPGLGLPEIAQGAGYAVFDQGGYTLSLEAGRARAPDGGAVMLGGSSLRIPVAGDGTMQEAALRLVLDTGVDSALSLLALEALDGDEGRLSGAEQFERGRAQIVADLDIPLLMDVRRDDVAVAVRGTLSDLLSTSLVPGRQLSAARLDLRADRTEAVLRGAVRLDGVPLDLRIVRPRGPEADGGGDGGADGATRIEGQVPLSRQTLERLGIALPGVALRGEAVGNFTLDLAPDTPPRLRVVSDLNRLSLAAPWLGAAKPANARGSFELAGTLGPAPRFETLRLAFDGLDLEGVLSLREEGLLEQFEITRLAAGRWLDVRGALVGAGVLGQPPRLVLSGGRLDLHRRPAQAADDDLPGLAEIDIALDAVGLGDALDLRGVSGRLVPGPNGFGGTLAARLRGREAGGGAGGASAPVQITLEPGPGAHPRLTLRSPDGAAVLQASGALPRAEAGGALELRLVPRAGAAGLSDGWLRINGLRVRDAPVLAELLSAISVIGLIEQLGGEGLYFSDVAARFEMTPEAFTIREAQATGASLGLSLSGRYDRAEATVDMEGVISPVYMLNAVGAVLSRPGEGLFGFAFRLDGPAASPDVRVNPLSILAPGILRELFRAR